MVEPYEKVNHPPHYGGDTPYEVVKVCEAWGLDKDAYLFLAVKYIGRNGPNFPPKPGEDPIRDLESAIWYLKRKVENMKQDRAFNTKPERHA